jgi:hypothetical protein
MWARQRYVAFERISGEAVADVARTFGLDRASEAD